MRIALICDWFSPRPGGMEAHLEGLSARLARAGHSIHIITSTPGDAGPNASGVVVHRLDAARIPGAGVVFAPSAIRGIGRILVDEKIDVAHSHVSIVAPVGIGGAFEGVRLGLPTVVTFHSFIPATPVWAWLVGRLVGASRWSATMTAVSTRVAREVRTFAPQAQFRILPNAIDTRFWTPGDQTSGGDRLTFVAVTRLRSKKRPMLLLEAAREIRRRLPSCRFRLRIAGSGPLEVVMRRFVDRHQLSDIVDFVGWRDPIGLRDLLRDSDVFLAPTARESFGLAALEARAVGLPVVAMLHSGVAEFIRDGESGILAKSSAGFVDAAVALAGDPSLVRRITAHNRAVQTSLTWEQSVRLHEAAYAEAIARVTRPEAAVA